MITDPGKRVFDSTRAEIWIFRSKTLNAPFGWRPSLENRDTMKKNRDNIGRIAKLPFTRTISKMPSICDFFFYFVPEH